MKIAQQLKEKNIAEYLIYMWQVEDLLRANGCDIDRIRQNIILRYPEEERPALEEWYGNLADMMRAEGVTEKGHLQINRNVTAVGTEQVLHLPHIYKVFGYILLFQLLRNLHDKMYDL